MKELMENYINTYIKPTDKWYLDLLVKRLSYIEWMAMEMGWSWLYY